MRRLLIAPFLIFTLLFGGTALAGMSLIQRTMAGTPGSGIDPSVNGMHIGHDDCKPPQPEAMQPGQLERLSGAFLNSLEHDPSFVEVWGSMGDCYQSENIKDPSRKTTREFLEDRIGMNFLLLDDKVKRYFNLPGDPADKSWAKISDPEKRKEKWEEAVDHDAKERFLSIASLARTSLGEIMYKKNCGGKNAPIDPWGKGLTRVIVNRDDMVQQKGSHGRANFTHFLQDEGLNYPSKKDYKPSLSSLRDLLFAFKQFSVWNPKDPNRHKVLCPAQKAGQIVTISEEEYQHNLRSEQERSKKNREPMRPVYRYTKLNKEHFKDWQIAVKFAYSAVLNRQGFKAETPGIPADAVFYTSTQTVHQDWAKQAERYVYVQDARVGQTLINDPNCLSVWQPQKMPPPTAPGKPMPVVPQVAPKK